MAGTQARSSGLFNGLVLITVGVLLLLHNYGHLELGEFFRHWWPLLIVFWGIIKLFERTVGKQFGGGAISAGELLLVFGMLALMGVVVAHDYVKTKVEDLDIGGDNYSYDLDVSPKDVPAQGHILVRTIRGDITVRGSDDNQIRVTAKKNAKTWSENEADHLAKPVTVEIAKNGDGFEVQPTGYDTSDNRISVDMEISLPKKSALTVKTEKGDIVVSDQMADITITNQNGDVEVRNTVGDVSVEMRKGDVKVSDTKGDVKVSGKGGEIDVSTASGSLTVEGDFYGPVRADKIAKGVRMVSPRTDLTVSALNGHLEAGSGNIDLIDAGGNVTLRTRDNEVNVENPGGKVDVENRNAQTSVRFSNAPKDDVQITNSSAEVSLTLPGNSSFEIEADCRNCDIDSEFGSLQPTKTQSGDSHLAGKSGSGKGPKVTVKTSYGNVAVRKSALSVPAPPKVPAVPAPPAPAEVPAPTEQ
ncbi:MAG TPA: DUF4097 family beta strand repeat-containing protein [Methylomirabilota bacterium]|nr:DUF4097 family beta strand repeat-containing protein [Methylomirabilota bacterium]